jgi:hypothetical protein
MIYKRYRHDGKANQMDQYHGSDTGAFWDIVTAHTWRKQKTYLVTHHLEVDFIPLRGFSELQTRGWQFSKFICNGRTVALYYSKDKAKLVVMNNGNLFESSIAAWGKLLGLPKLPMPDEKAPLTDWLTYCMRDTEVVVKMWDTLLDFLDKHDLGNFKITRASLALTAYKHRFMTHSIAIHQDAKATVLERRAYKGGRFEALRFGDFHGGPFYELDVTSMYAFVESWALLPYELRGYSVYPSWQEFIYRLQRYCVIATVDLEPKEAFVPNFKDGKVYYRAEPCRTTLCSPELAYSVKKGYIRQVVRMTWYYRAPVLKSFARYFTDLKGQYEQAGNAPMRTLAKLYPNAVYGKFAQRGFEDKIIGECDPETIEVSETLDLDNGKRGQLYKYGGKVHEIRTTLRSRDSFIAIAAHITAYARMYLWRLMLLAGLENVYHVATDSLTVNADGYRRLQRAMHPNRPGTLKVSKVFTEYSVKGINDVVQDGEMKCKGVPKKAITLDDNTYVVTEWPKITTLMKGDSVDTYYTRERTKVLARPEYHRAIGKVNESLWRKAKRLPRWDLLTEDESLEVFELQAQIQEWRQNRLIPHRVVFRLWDYKKGDFKRVKDAYGKLVIMEYTSAWGNMTELGFTDESQVLQAIKTQVTQDKAVRDSKDAIRQIWERTKYRACKPEPVEHQPGVSIRVIPNRDLSKQYLDLPLNSFSGAEHTF